MLPSAAEQALGQGIAALPFAVTDEQVNQLRTYLQLLNRWNNVHNLTAVRDPREQVIVHLLDCLAVMPYINRQGSLADIGSGAGLPALVIAIMRPELKVFAVESSNKKAAFIRQAVLALKLSNVEVVCRRVEDWKPAQKMDVIISRALAVPLALLDLTAHLGAEHCQWLMMCGHKPSIEGIAAFSVREEIAITVPLLNAVRTLIVIVKGGE